MPRSRYAQCKGAPAISINGEPDHQSRAEVVLSVIEVTSAAMALKAALASLFFMLTVAAFVDAQDGSCSASNPCSRGLCCSKWGYCGTGAQYCGGTAAPPSPISAPPPDEGASPPESAPSPSAAGGGHRGKIAIYWGQHDGEGDLIDVCNSGNYKVVLIAFLASFGNFLPAQINLANHCDPSNGGCTIYSKQIKACQAKGVQVLLSMGGGASGGYLVNDDDAKDLAKQLWNSYLGGHSSDRPLGPAALDGVDLDVEGGGIPERYAVFVKSLRSLAKGSKVVVSAAPQCPFPDLNLGSAVQTPGLFDYLFVQFYNNPCGYSGGSTKELMASWKQWTTAIPSAKIFLGLPASPSAAGSGFMPPDVCKNSVLPAIKSSSNYGGVMFWSVFYDEQEGYSKSIRSSV